MIKHGMSMVQFQFEKLALSLHWLLDIQEQSHFKAKMAKVKQQCKIFHILECELWLQQRGEFPATTAPTEDNFELYADLPTRFPPLPDRFSSLVLSDDWFMKKGASKQVPNDVMKSIASSWKSIKGEVRLYASAIALILNNRRGQISRLHSAHGQARRTILLVDQQQYQFQGQFKRASLPSNMAAAPAPLVLVSAPMPFQPFQAHHQMQSTSLLDMNSDRLAVYSELNRLSSIVASSCGFKLQEDPVIGSGFVSAPPAKQLDKLNVVEEPDIKVIWAQQRESIRAWADKLMAMSENELLEYFRSMELKSDEC
jgi:hypothetical protein